MKIATSHVFMMRPFSFKANQQTLSDNFYQRAGDESESDIQKKAEAEFDGLVNLLRKHEIEATVFQDDAFPETPDAVFPNNWVSFHEDGRVCMYPMKAPNRRGERREEIFDIIADAYGYEITEVEDFSDFEKIDLFLEGTGSMVIDRKDKLVYANLSERTDYHVLEVFCERLNYDFIVFRAFQKVGEEKKPIYHTNVMMSVGPTYALLGTESISDAKDRTAVLDTLKKSGRKIIDLTEKQLNAFAGNALHLEGKDGKPYLVMSSGAFESLRPDQVQAIEKHAQIIHAPLETIEKYGGGSARCMIAEIFLPKK